MNFLRKIALMPLSPLRRALLPVVAIVTALLCQGLLQALLPKGRDFPYAFFYLIAILVVAWWGGYLAGVVACLLTMVGLPWATSHHAPAVDPSRLILLLGVSLGISAVAASQRRNREALRRANDQLDLRVRDRTQDLESEVNQHKLTESRLKAQLERLNLLDQITRAIGERQDLASVYQVVIRRLEDHLPIDFGCVCMYDAATEMLTVTRIGVRSEALAVQMAMTEQSRIAIGKNGLAKCVQGHLVYEPDVSKVDFPFPQCLARSGLRAVVSAPLQVESRVFGVLIAARREPESFSSGECEFLRQLCEHVALASHQAQVYDALHRAYEDLRQTQQTVMQHERLRALGQMASGIAHDINNALSPVALYTEILLDTEPNLSEQTRRYLETTLRSVEDVAHTVGRMREFSRQHEPQLALSSVDLSALAKQILDLTQARWRDMPQQRGIVIQLRQELPEGLPAVGGVESEIREALTNLVLNAVDAMPDGGMLTLCAKVANRSNTPHVAIEVTDTGTGMSEATRRRCLDPFFTTKGERGTGLGLAMVYGIAQRHNAEIEIASELGKGTTMRLVFPAASPGQSEDRRDRDSGAVLTRLRILVVDDDPLIIKALCDALEADGHLVTTANGGKEGVEAFERSLAGDERFAVVLTDLGMPYVDGRKVSAAIKVLSPSTPIVLLTGWGQRLSEQGDIPPHVDRVLNKPPKLRELRLALRELVAGADLQALARELPASSLGVP